jgi:hypothetical protein
VIHRAGHQRVERRFADLRRRVGEQRPDGAAVGGGRDRVRAGARSARRATAITVPAEGAIATRATRSSVVSNGDSRMTGSLTELSVSAASRRISDRGASGSSLTASAMTARTRTASSATSAFSVSQVSR